MIESLPTVKEFVGDRTPVEQRDLRDRVEQAAQKVARRAETLGVDQRLHGRLAKTKL